jgi:hypothetical protein
MIEKFKELWAAHKWAGIVIFVLAAVVAYFAFKKGGALRKRRY